MVEISALMVKELREKSGAAMMDCKKALVESNGDAEKAFEWLRQKGSAAALKKASRVASEGLVGAAVNSSSGTGAIIEVNCETDFVARNEQFVDLVKDLVQAAIETKPSDITSFLGKSMGSMIVGDKVTDCIAKTGENIVIRRLEILTLQSPHGVIGMYVHSLGGKMGALVELKSSAEADRDQLVKIARDVAMHIVSTKPQFISRNEIPADVIENERRIESGKADLAEKKPEMRDKIVSGRLDKVLAERCLLEQPFVKEPNLTVAKYLAQKGSELSVELTPVRSALFILGEMATDADSSKV